MHMQAYCQYIYTCTHTRTHTHTHTHARTHTPPLKYQLVCIGVEAGLQGVAAVSRVAAVDSQREGVAAVDSQREGVAAVDSQREGVVAVDSQQEGVVDSQGSLQQVGSH